MRRKKREKKKEEENRRKKYPKASLKRDKSEGFPKVFINNFQGEEGEEEEGEEEEGEEEGGKRSVIIEWARRMVSTSWVEVVVRGGGEGEGEEGEGEEEVEGVVSMHSAPNCQNSRPGKGD